MTVAKVIMRHLMFKQLASVIKVLASLWTLAATSLAWGVTYADLTTNIAGTKNFSDVADNVDKVSQVTATLLIQLIAVGGLVIVWSSLHTLYKASKDEREKPTSALVGLIVGGLMVSIAEVVWIMKNSII